LPLTMHTYGNFAASMSFGIKYLVSILLVFSVLLTACSHKERIMTKKEMQAMADSIVNTKTAEMNKMAAEDLDRRRSIEVKAKADSIVGAWQAQHPQQPQDTSIAQ